jgi:hypothetical protein
MLKPAHCAALRPAIIWSISTIESISFAAVVRSSRSRSMRNDTSQRRRRIGRRVSRIWRKRTRKARRWLYHATKPAGRGRRRVFHACARVRGKFAVTGLERIGSHAGDIPAPAWARRYSRTPVVAPDRGTVAAPSAGGGTTMPSKIANRTTIAAANQMTFLLIGVWDAKCHESQAALTVPNVTRKELGPGSSGRTYRPS